MSTSQKNEVSSILPHTTMAAEQNERPVVAEGGEKKRLQLTHQEFYKACQALSTNAEEFLEKQYSRAEARKRLGELTGLHIGERGLLEMQEVTGVKWEPKRTPPRRKKVKDFAIRTLVTAVVRLYRKFGEEVPSSLADLYEDETGRRPTRDVKVEEQS